MSRVLSLYSNGVCFFWRQLISSLSAGWVLCFKLFGRTPCSLFAGVGEVCWGGQRGERGQRGIAGGPDVASFTGQEANLSPEGLSLLWLCFHQLLEPPNLLLVHTSPVILELSALDTHKQISMKACSTQMDKHTLTASVSAQPQAAAGSR